VLRADTEDRAAAEGGGGGGANGTSPVVMACSTLYISTGGVILGPGAESLPPPAVNATALSPTTRETVPSIR
jgi:hypothetical protein